MSGSMYEHVQYSAEQSYQSNLAYINSPGGFVIVFQYTHLIYCFKQVCIPRAGDYPGVAVVYGVCLRMGP